MALSVVISIPFHNLDGTCEPGANGFVLFFDLHDAKPAGCRRCEGMMKTEMRHADVFFDEHQQEPFPDFGIVFHTVDYYFNHDAPDSYPSDAAPLVEAMAWA